MGAVPGRERWARQRGAGTGVPSLALPAGLQGSPAADSLSASVSFLQGEEKVTSRKGRKGRGREGERSTQQGMKTDSQHLKVFEHLLCARSKFSLKEADKKKAMRGKRGGPEKEAKAGKRWRDPGSWVPRSGQAGDG